MSPLKSMDTDTLFQAILSLESIEDCYHFFEDVCTPKEIQDLSQRFATAILLRKGKNYNEIAKKVGVSTATISRVNRCLQYGAGGYRKALDNLNIKEEKKGE